MILSVFNFNEIQTLIEDEKYYESILQILESYEKLGPLPGILLPFSEAFLPFLPAVVFVMANSMAYGLFQGFFLSWLGASLGSIAVFTIIRGLRDWKPIQFIRKNRQVQKVMDWVERHGFGPIFLLLCFPFSPSAVINTVAGLSRVNFQQFVLAVFLGKTLMIFTVSYIGTSITSFAESPVKSVVIGICILLFWFIGKYVERRLQRKRINSESKSK
ncbi:TVP38/TMEM64 family protein [Bacillaceae bacterium S4-13-58]